MSASLEQDILVILRSKLTRADQVTELAALLTETPVEGVQLLNTRATVEQAEVHGLVIGLDAAGAATWVEFPCGVEESW